MRSTEELIGIVNSYAERDETHGQPACGAMLREAADRLAAQAAEISRLKAPWTEEEYKAASEEYRALQGTGLRDNLHAALRGARAVRLKEAEEAALAVRMGGENG